MWLPQTVVLHGVSRHATCRHSNWRLFVSNMQSKLQKKGNTFNYDIFVSSTVTRGNFKWCFHLRQHKFNSKSIKLLCMLTRRKTVQINSGHANLQRTSLFSIIMITIIAFYCIRLGREHFDFLSFKFPKIAWLQLVEYNKNKYFHVIEIKSIGFFVVLHTLYNLQIMIFSLTQHNNVLL